LEKGKSSYPRDCWCQCPESVKEFRFFALNGYEEDLPPGWVGQIHDLTDNSKT
jgi:hypothetical protein